MRIKTYALDDWELEFIKESILSELKEVIPHEFRSDKDYEDYVDSLEKLLIKLRG